MPRKKLTKAQVKKKMNQIERSMGDLMIDKTFYRDSYVGMSLKKILELQNRIRLTVIK